MTRLNLLPRTVEEYERAAQEYFRSLPLEHFMEAKTQAKQREITLESLALLQDQRPDVQVFNEMLVQYPFEGGLGQVVPDNMIVVVKEPTRAEDSFNLPFEPAGPFFVIDYVFPMNPRKDYEDSFRKYEKELRVPYCFLLYLHRHDLRVYRHGRTQYKLLKPNAAGRFAIPELDLEVGLRDDWARFWYRGNLLELPGELWRQLCATKQQLDATKLEVERQLARREKRRAEKEKQLRATAEAEVERLRALVEQLERERQEKKRIEDRG